MLDMFLLFVVIPGLLATIISISFGRSAKKHKNISDIDADIRDLANSAFENRE